MILKKILPIILCSFAVNAAAQDLELSDFWDDNPLDNSYQRMIHRRFYDGYFDHLDASISVGSTGIGFDFGMPIGEYVGFRLGGAFMPRFNYKMHFNVLVGGVAEEKYDADGNRVETRFDRLSGLLKSMTGNDIDDNIEMVGTPSMYNAKLLIDLFPLKNKHFHITTGVYAGSKCFAIAKNSIHDMTSLMAVSMYNNMYYKILAEEPLLEYNGMSAYLPSEFTDRVAAYGLMSMPLGEFTHDVIAKEDVLYDHNEIDDITGEVIHAVGEVRVGRGEVLYHRGDTYNMLPDKDNTVTVKAKSWALKPYVGIGYGGSLTRNGRTQLSFDAGVMFWGGKPRMITHEGVDLVHDLTNIGGKVGDYVNLASKFPVYPVLEFRLSHRIF